MDSCRIVQDVLEELKEVVAARTRHSTKEMGARVSFTASMLNESGGHDVHTPALSAEHPCRCCPAGHGRHSVQIPADCAAQAER